MISIDIGVWVFCALDKTKRKDIEMNKLFIRSQYEKEVSYKIIPFWKKIGFIIIESGVLCGTLLAIYKEQATWCLSGLVFIYLIALAEYAFEIYSKKKLFMGRFDISRSSIWYMEKSEQSIWLSLLVAFACSLYLIINGIEISMHNIREYYWIWFLVMLFLGVFFPFHIIVSGFDGMYYMSGNFIIDYSKITSIQVVKERNTTKGLVYEIELFVNNKKVGFDRVHEEDFRKLKDIVIQM